MTDNEERELLTLARDNNKMLQDIWTSLKLGDPNDDAKDFVMNIIANLAANKLEGNVGTGQRNITRSNNI